MKKKIVMFLVICTLLSLLVTACVPKGSTTTEPEIQTGTEEKVEPQEPERVIKDNLIVILKGEPSNIDPHNNGELVAFTIQMQIYDNLVTRDVQGNIIPMAATRWETINDTTVRFFLREDIVYHNGEKLTAEDVAFSIKRATEMPFSANIFSAFDGGNTKVVDEYTVDVATKGPFGAIFNYLASTRGAILDKTTVEKLGDDAYGRNPVGSGPFKFETWLTGTEIKVVRNEEYWGEKPEFSSITFKFISEAATRVIEIESGNADFVFDVSPSDVPRLTSNDDLSVITCNSFGYSFAAMNNQHPIMGDIRVRQALSLAIDRTSLVNAVYGDLATVADSVIPATIFSYKSQGPSEYNIEKAKDLLADAGYGDGLDIQLNVQDTQEVKDIAEILQSMWASIGVKAELVISATPEYIAAARRGDFPINISAANYGTGDPGHALADFDTRTNAVYHSNDTKIDEYLDRGGQIYDQVERAKVYQELQAYITEQYYLIPLGFKMVIYVTTDNIENYTCHPGNSPYLGDILPYDAD